MMGAILGIAVSLIPLVLVLVVSDGMIQGITRRYIETKTYHIQAALPYNFTNAEAKAGIAALSQLHGVGAVYFERSGMGLAVAVDKSHAINIRSISSAFFKDKGTTEYLRVEAGADTPSGRGALVGTALASELSLKVGDPLTLVTTGRRSGVGGSLPYSPKLSFFRVAGIVGAGYRDLDALWVFIDEEKGGELLDSPSSSACFGVKVADPYSNSLGMRTEEIDARLASLYPERIEPFFVRTWPELEKSLFRSFGTTKSMLAFIMGLALIIAAVNLGSALSTFVIEHSLDIAIMRSFGASDASLRRIFAGAGLATGILGTALGLILGLILSCNVNTLIAALEWLVNIGASVAAALSGRQFIPVRLLDPGYYLDLIPVVVDYRQILAIGLASVALSVFVSLLPANKAVRIPVQEVIRKS
ncbi:MAG: FtsX-like permease family protein [Spirochaetes bacterium]|nr:FtsX-like permease family protein [Spirochaetota bacterium]